MSQTIIASGVTTSLFFWGEGSAWFWVMVQSAAILITLGFIYWQVRLSRYSNMLQTILKFRDIWSSDSMMKNRRDTCETYRKKSTSIRRVEEEVLTFFEEIGLLVEKRVVSEEFVWESYSYYIEYYWAMLEKNVQEYRKSTKDKSWFEHFEKLNHAMREFSRKRGLPSTQKTAEEIDDFIDSECER